MREILFRGKRRDNGEWVYGSLITERNMFDENLMTRHIQDIEEPYADNLIDGETIGQYTGLTDKNGRKIFEGDIVEFYDYCNGGTCIGKIEYSDEDTAFQIMYDETYCLLLGYNFHGLELEVIGNIHDNPELLNE